MKSAVVLLPIIASVINGPLVAQWANFPTARIPRTADGKPNLAAPAPRTADGKPDLSGLWDKISPKYDRNIAADLKPGEVQPWAEALDQQRSDDLGKDCSPRKSWRNTPVATGRSTPGTRDHPEDDRNHGLWR